MRWRRKTTGDPHGGRRTAAVYGRGQTYVVASDRRFGYGPSYRSPPYFVVPRTASAEELGAAVLRAIEGFVYLDAEPSQIAIDEANRELFAVVGVKDEATFGRGASLVNVAERSGRWVVRPWDRRSGAWYPMKEELNLHLTAPSADEVGTAVRRAFITIRGVP